MTKTKRKRKKKQKNESLYPFCFLSSLASKKKSKLVRLFFSFVSSDFGLSRVIDHTTQMTGNVGTVAWVAPELFAEKKNYSAKADVYR